MTVRSFLLLLVALLCAGAVQAGDFEDGVAAYNRKDYATALEKLRSAAQQGDIRAQLNLGEMYERGGFVARDLKEAVRWYQLAAQQGAVNAQLNLGKIYELGQGVAQDYKEALRWFQLAARQGSPNGQFNLGFMYESGRGVAQDYKEAVRWYRLAVAQGDQNAKRQLEIAEKKASETSITVATSNQTETRIKPSDAETERKKRQEVEELLAQERRAKTAELEAANRKQKELEARLRESAERERSASEARVKANEIEELLAQERKAKAAELEAANKKQQELEARLRESAERERLASEARLQPSQTEPTAQAQRPQIAARKERRLALVIGNSNYKGSPLDNPANDATDIASQLKSFGFQTTLLRDATLNQMRDATRKFADQLPSTDVALVYFAGHGIEMKGRNYMIPINADVKFEYELSEQAYDAGIWLEMLETIKSSNADRVNIVILDACRNNGLIAARSLSKGLGKMDAPSGTFLAYSTSPGKIASDGARGERNSPFTKHLIKAMQQANKPIEEVFKEVRRNVGKDTNGSQVPWESTSLTGFFTFKQSQ